MDNSPKVETSGNAFLNHMFGDKDTKSNVINIIQYSLFGIIPILILNKAMHHIFPDADDKKNNLELSVEIIGQLAMLFIGIFFVDRLIRYFKVYSGEKYDDVSVLNLILPIMIILFSIPSKIGQKTKIMMDRIMLALNIEKGPETEEKIEIKPTIPIMTDIRDMMGHSGTGDVPPALQSVATTPPKAPKSVGRVSTNNSNNSNNSNANANTDNFNNMFEPLTSGGIGYTSF